MVDHTAQRVARLPGDVLAWPGPSPSVIYRHLTIDGWSAREAGNLVARLLGLHSARQGWTVNEIDHLLFLRAMVDAGRLDS
jgi:hypothetical protein